MAKKQINIGSRVRLNEEVVMSYKTFLPGHEFTVYGSSERGWDLVDDEGLKLDETRMIDSQLEAI